MRCSRCTWSSASCPTHLPVPATASSAPSCTLWIWLVRLLGRLQPMAHTKHAACMSQQHKQHSKGCKTYSWPYRPAEFNAHAMMQMHLRCLICSLACSGTPVIDAIETGMCWQCVAACHLCSLGVGAATSPTRSATPKVLCACRQRAGKGDWVSGADLCGGRPDQQGAQRARQCHQRPHRGLWAQAHPLQGLQAHTPAAGAPCHQHPSAPTRSLRPRDDCVRDCGCHPALLSLTVSLASCSLSVGLLVSPFQSPKASH